MKKKHRDSQRRIHFDDAVYFVTCKTKDNYPFFKENIFCDLFVENLRICKKLKEFILYGWVLIYDHFHLLIRPNGKFGISEVMHFLKRHVSRNINIVMGYTINKSTTPTEGADGHPRLRITGDPNVNQMINKFDKQIIEFQNQFHQKYSNKNPYPKFQWQKSYHDHYIRNDNDFEYHLGYITNNPNKHKLPDEWEYVFMNEKYDDLADNIN